MSRRNTMRALLRGGRGGVDGLGGLGADNRCLRAKAVQYLCPTTLYVLHVRTLARPLRHNIAPKLMKLLGRIRNMRPLREN